MHYRIIRYYRLTPHMVLYSVQVRRFGLWWHVSRDFYINETQAENYCKLHTEHIKNRKQKRKELWKKFIKSLLTKLKCN